MVNGKPVLNDIWALFTNPVFIWGYSKVLFAALVTGSMVMLAVSAWQLRHGKDREVFTRSAHLSLVTLVPGVIPSGGSNSPWISGGRNDYNDVTIDGAPTTSRANANQVTASYVPPTDIVQEFKVQTATFDAQFGQTQGGVTNISIKSGTNTFHGSAGYSFQRPSFWANDFFLNKNGTPRPDFLFNRWGGSIGGPVHIPHVYNGKNKTFFLFGYEGIHDSRPRHDDTTNTVPTPAVHNGDFSALFTR